MAETLRIFVSATGDMEAERAVIGRALAELPVKIRAEIRRTPVEGAKYDDMWELIGNVDRVYFLLGSDITAPAGAEWQLALQLERSLLPLRAAHVRLTPAGQEFIHKNPFIRWQEFDSAAELAQTVTLDLLEMLNHRTNRYGLSITELETLRLHRERLQQRAASRAARMAHELGGAEGGGVIIDPLRSEAAEDLLLQER
ncbi:MAG: hypothetical protein R2911_17545 [Caldilineaceae bacterium]